MKKQTIVASSLLMSLMVGTASAAMMWDDMEKNMNKAKAEIMTVTTDAWEEVQIQVMEMKNETKKVSWGMVEDMSEKAKKMEEKGEWMMGEMKEMGEKAENKMKDMEEKGEWMMKDMEEKGEKMMEKTKEKLEKAKKYAGKKAEKADEAMEKYMKKLENKKTEEKIAEYKKLNEKIDQVMAKYMNADISEEKKESYRNLFEYIRALNEEKIAELEETE